MPDAATRLRSGETLTAEFPSGRHLTREGTWCQFCSNDGRLSEAMTNSTTSIAGSGKRSEDLSELSMKKGQHTGSWYCGRARQGVWNQCQGTNDVVCNDGIAVRFRPGREKPMC